MSVKLKQLKAVAKAHELLAVDFIMHDGRLSSEYPNHLRNKYAKVKLEFSNGDLFTITKHEFESLGDFKFTLAEKHKTNH